MQPAYYARMQASILRAGAYASCIRVCAYAGLDTTRRCVCSLHMRMRVCRPQYYAHTRMHPAYAYARMQASILRAYAYASCIRVCAYGCIRVCAYAGLDTTRMQASMPRICAYAGRDTSRMQASMPRMRKTQHQRKTRMLHESCKRAARELQESCNSSMRSAPRSSLRKHVVCAKTLRNAVSTAILDADMLCCSLYWLLTCFASCRRAC
jgi:hypothetical protein